MSEQKTKADLEQSRPAPQEDATGEQTTPAPQVADTDQPAPDARSQAGECEHPNAGEAPAEESPASDDQERAASPQEQIAALREENEQLHARILRATADYQNYVRRSSQNLVNDREQQTMNMARALITVLDHFDRALEVDTEKTTAQNLLEGVQIVRDELMHTLERFGVERLDVKAGDEFDPNRHEALMRKMVEGIQPNHVVDQLQPGYILGDKTLRPAQVSVAE